MVKVVKVRWLRWSRSDGQSEQGQMVKVLDGQGKMVKVVKLK